MNFDLDLAGFGRLLLREGRWSGRRFLYSAADFIGFDRVWECEAAEEIAVAALDTVIALYGGVLFKSA